MFRVKGVASGIAIAKGLLLGRQLLQFLFWELQIGGEGRRLFVHILVSTISLLTAFVSLVQPDRHSNAPSAL